MKRKNQIYRFFAKGIFVGFLMVGVLACGGGGGNEEVTPPEPDPEPEEKLEVTPAGVSADVKGGTYTVDVTATSTWTVNADSSWCVPTKNGNQAVLTVKANPYEISRTTKVKIVMGALSRTVTVTQAAIPPVIEQLEVGETKVDAVYYAKEYTIEVTSNVEWTVSSDNNWCVVARDNNKVKVNLQLNEGDDERSATVTVKGTKLQRLVQISQAEITLRGRDSIALVKVWETTGGTNWKVKWNTLQSLNQWTGVKMDADGKRVVELVLRGNGLSGSIPVELWGLTSLTKLDCGNNSLTGNLSTAISSLKLLEELSLDSNRLTGNLPADLNQLTKLRILDVSNNSFNGALPSGLSSLNELVWLRLSHNELTGNLPEEWKILRGLVVMDLSLNKLEGVIPSAWMSGMTKLEYLYLHENQFSQDIPIQVIGLYVLKSLALDNNNLTGEIPDDLGNLPSLMGLWLHNNQLTGSIPASLTGHRLWLQWKSIVCPQEGNGFSDGCPPVSRSTVGCPPRPLPDKQRFQ